MKTIQLSTPTISKDIFNILIDIAKCEDAELDGNISFASKYMNYEIGFYQWSEDKDLTVQDFGFMKNKQWLQCEPTESQIEQMNKMIQNKYESLISGPGENNGFTTDDRLHQESLIH